MKISIQNFKSINSLSGYAIQPLTILSGTNSSGKSSLIQFLLLLKQTIELDSAKYPLYMDGDFFPVRRFQDILSSNAKDNCISVELAFDRDELRKYSKYPEIGIYDVLDDLELRIKVEFVEINNRVAVRVFEVRFISKDGSFNQFLKISDYNGSLNINTNVATLSNSDLLSLQGTYKITNVNYSGFIPFGYEIDLQNGSTPSKELLKLDGIKAIIVDFFHNLNYVGPSRDEPREEYRYNGQNLSVGSHGEFVADTLEALSLTSVVFFKIQESEGTYQFIKCDGTFLDAVRYWMCEKFQMCKDIYAKKVADSVVIYVVNFNDIESSIRHVGFGISQILPIVVEGLRIQVGQTLILEQPEIHLHPKVQSQCLDFMLSLVYSGKTILVETHSDHIITRLRRRVAENTENDLSNLIALTFVESTSSDLLYRNIGINDFGGLDYFPDEFIEKTDVELKAILKAQMKKRLNQK